MRLPVLHCKRCGHKWYPRTPKKPEVCPKCKSPLWDKDRVRKKGGGLKKGVKRKIK